MTSDQKTAVRGNGADGASPWVMTTRVEFELATFKSPCKNARLRLSPPWCSVPERRNGLHFERRIEAVSSSLVLDDGGDYGGVGKVTRTDGVATVLLNRPEAFNAINFELAECFTARMFELAADRAVRAIVITGEGKAFCAGGDLKTVLTLPEGAVAGFHKLAAGFHQAVLEIRRMPKPVIAAINGVAAGGGFSLAIVCDFRVIARSAVLRQAYTSSGLSMDGGGSFSLPRLVGFARAMEIAAFDRPISSDQALAWGLVTKIAEDGKAVEDAVAMARELAGRSLTSFGWSKKLFTDSFNTSFETHIEREREGLCACTASPDGIEGLTAFVEKRKPVFS